MSVSTGGQGSKEKSRAPKTKSTVASKVLNIQNSNADASIRHNKAVMDDPSNCTQDQKNAQRRVICFHLNYIPEVICISYMLNSSAGYNL